MVNAFAAIGTAPNGEEYRCDFNVRVDMSQNPTQQQMNGALQFAMNQFKQYHPTGRIVAQKNFQMVN